MKTLATQLSFFMQSRTARRNVSALLRLLLVFVVLVAVYTYLFHVLMLREGREHTWATGIYWTLTVMSTLGFGDITFETDTGRLFSMVVLLSGVAFLLVIIPFTFLQFFYAPWMEAQSRARTPRVLPADTRDHVILTQYDPVTVSLIARLESYGRGYVVLESDPVAALALYDKGVRVVLGYRDDGATYRNLRADQAAMVVTTGDDYTNAAVSFTVREISESVPIVSFVRAHESEDILQLAGASHVLNLAEMLGRSLARRTLGGASRANIIGQFDTLLIAEAPVTGTPLVGRTLAQSELREVTGVTVVGVWDRGAFVIPSPDFVITSSSVLVLAGSAEQLEQFDELVLIYNPFNAPVVVLGAGRVGRAAVRHLRERGIPYRIVDRNPARLRGEEHGIVGSAAEREVLEQAGIGEAPTAIVTTNEDATNIYLTIYCRKLRPDIQIIARSTLERNVSTLHRAGADFVMSYASMGASAVFNVLEQNDVVMLAEGLDVFRYPTPPTLIGKPLRATRIREQTGCSVIAVEHDGRIQINPDPAQPIPSGSELILIGTTEAERAYVRHFAA